MILCRHVRRHRTQPQLPPAILLRESFRLNGKVLNRTLANISHWPPAKIDALRSVLRGATSVGAPLPQAFDIVRSRPHGHVAAVLGTLHRLDLDLVASRTAAPSVRNSSLGTTRSTATPGSSFSRHPWFTTARPAP